MVKNVKGGSGHKGLARKHVVLANSQKNSRLKEDMEYERYAVVTAMLGDKCFVLCDDDKKRLCCIRGKFRGRKKRDNMVVVGGWVLIGIRSFETEKVATSSSSSSSSSSYVGKCDLMEIYGDHEKKDMQEKDPDEYRNMLEKSSGIGKSKSQERGERGEGDDSFDFISDMEAEAMALMKKKGGGGDDDHDVKLLLEKKDSVVNVDDDDDDDDDDDEINIDDI